MTTASSEAFARLQRAVHIGRKTLPNGKNADPRMAEGVFISDSEQILDAAETFFGQFGDMDDALGADLAASGLPAADLPSSLQHLNHAVKATRKCLQACELAKGRGDIALRVADTEYITSMKKLMDVADNTSRLAAKPVPKPTPAPAPAPKPIDTSKIADAVFESVRLHVENVMGKHADAERETVQRLVTDKLGDLKDSLRTREDMRELKEMHAASEMDRRLAGLGKTVNAMVNRRIEESQSKVLKDAVRLVKANESKIRKELLDRLEDAETESQHVVGEMPLHEWRGTEVRFEVAPGVWGEWTDLEGPAGRNGLNGGGGGVPRNLVLDGGGAFDENTGLDGEFASTNFAGVPGLGGGGADTVYSATTFNAGRAI